VCGWCVRMPPNRGACAQHREAQRLGGRNSQAVVKGFRLSRALSSMARGLPSQDRRWKWHFGSNPSNDGSGLPHFAPAVMVTPATVSSPLDAMRNGRG
jgi:hypothetical protein